MLTVEDPGRGQIEVPAASVVVCTRDRADQLEQSLGTLIAQTHPEYEILVVDNAPVDDTTERIVARVASSSSVTIRYVTEPRPGLSWARNRGVAEAAHEIIAFTDDDTVQRADWLLHLALPFVQAEVGCTTGLSESMFQVSDEQRWRESYAGAEKFGRVPQRFTWTEGATPALHPFATGAIGSGMNMAFRRSALQRIGGFDVALGAGTKTLGGEDLLAFFEILQSGFTIVYEPQAIVAHAHRESERELEQQMYSWGTGLTAYLTSALIRHPRVAPLLLRKMAAGIRHALSPRSEKNSRKPEDYPKRLSRLERRGFLVGPALYLRARWAVRSHA